MTQYILYFRVSTKAQGESGLGLEAQARDCQLFLTAHGGSDANVLERFTDVESGRADDRPELAKALDLARETGATLLVAKLDRLSRKVSFLANLMDDRRLSLKVASMPFADKFQLHIYAALAEQEREFISKRTKAALASAKLRGVKLGGLRDKTNRRNEARKHSAQEFASRMITIVRPLREAGQTLASIAGTLNTMQLPSARGAEWTPTQVARVLERASL